MGLRVTFELDDNDLRHFQLIMEQARSSAARISPEDVVASAEDLLARIELAETSAFVAQRLQKLQLLIAMLSDIEWRLPQAEAGRVLNALAYFAEPEDLIPDSIPALGLLDDAIMIELICRELKHEIEAYQDFCEYRKRIRADSGPNVRVSRDDWLDNRRARLQSRMRRRKRRDRTERPGRGIDLLR
jgi:uncharacterized membrane protein YkvA (DUF1232 family)